LIHINASALHRAILGERRGQSPRLTTICALLGIPGFKPFTDLLAQFYGFYGYSVSTVGIAIGALWGLIDGFIHFGVFAWLYNILLSKTIPMRVGQ